MPRFSTETFCLQRNPKKVKPAEMKSQETTKISIFGRFPSLDFTVFVFFYILICVVIRKTIYIFFLIENAVNYNYLLKKDLLKNYFSKVVSNYCATYSLVLLKNSISTQNWGRSYIKGNILLIKYIYYYYNWYNKHI